MNYLFCSSRPWSISAFMALRRDLPGNWCLCVSQNDLAAAAKNTSPRFIFFPHWSDIVSQDILDTHECVCFHMTDVPYGRSYAGIWVTRRLGGALA
jgi:methionyl-tRNA formyltransferase